MDIKRILIATHPFGRCGRKPLEILKATGHELVFNPCGRRLKESDMVSILPDIDAIIAGTEPYRESLLRRMPRLKAIFRVGIGLDSVDLHVCRELGITVTYTPDAPSAAVAELTVANILNLARHIHVSDQSVREGAWNRLVGRLVREMTIGVVGVGRIGKRVIELLQSFAPNILACDIKPDEEFGKKYNLVWCDKEKLFRESDLVTLHIPSNRQTRNYVDRDTIAMMKTDSFLINTSRGPVLDETGLLDALRQGHLAGAALDVFQKEPYEGPLAKLDNVILTAHIGASATECRYLMELGAAEDCVNWLTGLNPGNLVPEEEYNL
jgi:D-3-phosphoglycerate dehydrogenase / 2-oxoglutarate reductase